MTSAEIRRKFLEFFEKNGHTIVPSSSLIPDDPSVLLTTAGMQQFKLYYSELDPEKTIHPSIGKPIGKNVVSIQKCFRTSDIDEVGDESHLTFFEMLGNFSFGGYGKEDAIKFAFEFITKEMKLEISYVTVFEGLPISGVIPKDDDSKKIWKSLGVNDIREEGIKDVFWGPTGSEGPCGPTTEIYCRSTKGQDVEIWNIVFNQYYCYGSREQLLNAPESIKLKDIPLGIDTGMGFERLTMVSQNVPTIFDTDLFQPLISILRTCDVLRLKRVIADHARAIAFLISDGIRPSNKEAGYVLRRLIRRIIAYGTGVEESLFISIIKNYNLFYPELGLSVITEVFLEEKKKFSRTLEIGLKELKKLDVIDAKIAFSLYESFGLPYETIKEVVSEKAKNLKREDFDAEFKKHQEISRAGQEKKFGGHGLILDTGELKAADEKELKIVTRLHTATHMLQAALRQVLGNSVKQAGSDITVERTRFDFTFERKLTPEEIKKVEDIVNEKIKEDLPMQKIVLPKAEAEKTGALYFFKEKYPDPVNVYFVGKSLETAFSKEFCGGPHITRTGEIGKFKIVKEEAVGFGVRRIRAIVDKIS